MSRKAHIIAAAICFIIIPVYLIFMVVLYDYFAHIYQSPSHPVVNLTGIAAFLGTAALFISGIFNAVKATRKK